MPKGDNAETELDALYRECRELHALRKGHDAIAKSQAAYIALPGGTLDTWALAGTVKALSPEIDFVRVGTWRGYEVKQMAAVLWPRDAADPDRFAKACARVHEYRTRLKKLGAIV